jgi:3-oxoadipate enol-lactonase
VLTGENDGDCNPRIYRFIADELNNAKLVILDRLKHAILIADPEAVLSQLKPFLLQQI